MERQVSEGSLHKWFKGSKSKDGKGGWVNVVTGGTCASDEPGEGTPKCVSSAKRASMTKAERLSAARRKKKDDPGQQQKSGAAKPTYVSTDSPRKKKKKKMNEGWSDKYKQSIDCDNPKGFSQKAHCQGKKKMKETYERSLTPLTEKAKKCWPGYEKKGTKKMFGKTYNNCVKKEEVELTEVKDKKGKGSGTKDACYHKVKSRYSVWPSAYASGALVKCRKVGAANWGNSSKKEDFSDWKSEFIWEDGDSSKKLDENILKRLRGKRDLDPYIDLDIKPPRPLPPGKQFYDPEDNFTGPKTYTKPTPKPDKPSKPIPPKPDTKPDKPSLPSPGGLDNMEPIPGKPGRVRRKPDAKIKPVPLPVPPKPPGSAKPVPLPQPNFRKPMPNIIRPGDNDKDRRKPMPDMIRPGSNDKDKRRPMPNIIRPSDIPERKPMPLRPGDKVERKPMPLKPGDKPKIKLYKDHYDWRADLGEDWQKTNRQDKTDGMSQKAVNAYRRENPGSKLKTAVTKKPSSLKRGSKDAKRRKSFCSRMKGMKKRLTSAKTARDPDSRINKALRRWNC